jgi:hypothetical protein
MITRKIWLRFDVATIKKFHDYCLAHILFLELLMLAYPSTSSSSSSSFPFPSPTDGCSACFVAMVFVLFFLQ